MQLWLTCQYFNLFEESDVLNPSSRGPDVKSVYVDSNTRIQVIDTMLMLPHADKEQCAAFIASIIFVGFH